MIQTNQLLSGRTLSKGLLFLGLDSTGKLNQIYACLYGIHGHVSETPGTLPTSFVPVIPDGVALLSLLQLVISAVLIFLVLLALRNYFRIK